MASAIIAFQLRHHLSTEQKPTGRILLNATSHHSASVDLQLSEREETENGKVALQPHSERPRAHPSQPLLPSLAGELWASLATVKGPPPSIPPDDGRLALSAAFLSLAFQIQNCEIENTAD